MYFFVFFFSQGGGFGENMYFRYYCKMKIFKWLRFQNLEEMETYFIDFLENHALISWPTSQKYLWKISFPA